MGEVMECCDYTIHVSGQHSGGLTQVRCCSMHCHTVQHTHIRAEEVTSRLLAVACALIRIASASPAAVLLTNDKLVKDCRDRASCLHHHSHWPPSTDRHQPSASNRGTIFTCPEGSPAGTTSAFSPSLTLVGLKTPNR